MILGKVTTDTSSEQRDADEAYEQNRGDDSSNHWLSVSAATDRRLKVALCSSLFASEGLLTDKTLIARSRAEAKRYSFGGTG
jgi:hypothetical protein